MLEIPSLPGWDALHLLVIHFPVALILIVPIFIILGLFWKRHRECILIFSFILLILGTVSIFIAIETGEEAAEVITKSAEISSVLEEHSELAHASQIIFSILTIVYAAILFLPSFLKKEIKPAIKQMMVVIFLIIFLICMLVLANTASYGGQLVHRLGVHAMM